jgi:hypothetical protein
MVGYSDIQMRRKGTTKIGHTQEKKTKNGSFCKNAPKYLHISEKSSNFAA